MITLRGEVRAPDLPTGRLEPVDLNGVELRVGQVWTCGRSYTLKEGKSGELCTQLQPTSERPQIYVDRGWLKALRANIQQPRQYALVCLFLVVIEKGVVFFCYPLPRSQVNALIVLR